MKILTMIKLIEELDLAQENPMLAKTIYKLKEKLQSKLWSELQQLENKFYFD